MLRIAPSRAAPLFAAILLLAACSPGEPPSAVAHTVLVETVSNAAAAYTSYTGEIRARHEVELSFRVAGKLASRLVDAGAEIKAGQPLARLDPADLQLAASAARAQLTAAESDLATALAERERYAGLLAKKFVSQAAFDAKDNALNGARGRLEQARSQERISGNQAGYGILSSEFPAVVTGVLADAGQVVSAGQAVLRVARPEEKEIAIAIPESRLAEFKAARAFSVYLWADPKIRLSGELRELSPVADAATRTYAARIRLDHPPPEAGLGMTARVVLADQAEIPLLVPLSAVVDQGKGPMVWVVRDGKVASRPVTVAQFRENGATIAAGLHAGEMVVVAGTSKLVDGQAVQPRQLNPPERQR